jgi:hypothetical protein
LRYRLFTRIIASRLTPVNHAEMFCLSKPRSSSNPSGVRTRLGMTAPEPSLSTCYHATVFNFGKPKTVGDWIVHIAGAVVALFLVWWMLHLFVL